MTQPVYQPVYQPGVIVRNIAGPFFKYRGFTLLDDFTPTDDNIISKMTQYEYVRLNARHELAVSAPDTASLSSAHDRDRVIVLILNATGKYSNHGPDIRKLLNSIEGEATAKQLEEIIIVVDPSFFTKKSLMEEIKKKIAADTQIHINIYPYYIFACVVPEHKSVPKHIVMNDDEVAKMFAMEFTSRQCLPVILHNDAPIVWNGGRAGQVVKIIRDSEIAGEAIVYRRIERAF
jgi:DNA-directed RNA polymerase subunit H (RpoH/RPB5)